MAFIVSGESAGVKTVNGAKGDIILDYNNVGAIANILDSCNGIQVGTTSERPVSAKDNVLFLVTDVTPNRFYRYSTSTSKWELVGGSESGGGDVPTEIIALDVDFNNLGSDLIASNVQDAIIELQNLIKDKSIDWIEF